LNAPDRRVSRGLESVSPRGGPDMPRSRGGVGGVAAGGRRFKSLCNAIEWVVTGAPPMSPPWAVRGTRHSGQRARFSMARPAIRSTRALSCGGGQL